LLFPSLQLAVQRNPPLPLDLDTPYYDESLGRTKSVKPDDELSSVMMSDRPYPNNNNNNHQYHHRNILVNSYNPVNSDSTLRNSFTKMNNKNIISNTYGGSSNGGSGSGVSRVNNNFTATNLQTNSRPNHKTHVELITKNGPTKKPNIIVNNYNPDLIFANNVPNHHLPPPRGDHPSVVGGYVKDNVMIEMIRGNMPASMMTNTSPIDRKSTCMLYLQADHTFFQKLGSDEASIEAITRHVQRANVIYRNTGEQQHRLQL